jgi:hypothetical protein
LHYPPLGDLRMSTAGQDLEKNKAELRRLVDPPPQKPRREVLAIAAKRWQSVLEHTTVDRDGADLPRLRPDQRPPHS